MSKNKLYLIIFVMGCMGAVMNSANGYLSAEIGLVQSSLFVHSAGLVVSFLLYKILDKRGNDHIMSLIKAKPYLFLGGVLGAFAVVTVSVGIIEIGVFSTSMALIAGQFISALIIDYFGWFGFEKVEFNKYKVTSIGLMIIGVVLLSI